MTITYYLPLTELLAVVAIVVTGVAIGQFIRWLKDR